MGWACSPAPLSGVALHRTAPRPAHAGKHPGPTPRCAVGPNGAHHQVCEGPRCVPCAGHHGYPPCRCRARSRAPFAERPPARRPAPIALRAPVHHYFVRAIIRGRIGTLHPDRHGVHIVPNGVDTDHFNQAESNLWTGPHRILTWPFATTWATPNIVAARFLVDEIAPALKREPGAFASCCGAQPAAAVLALRQDHVTVVADVPDIRSAYLAAPVFAAPMLVNTGLEQTAGSPRPRAGLRDHASGADAMDVDVQGAVRSQTTPMNSPHTLPICWKRPKPQQRWDAPDGMWSTALRLEGGLCHFGDIAEGSVSFRGLTLPQPVFLPHGQSHSAVDAARFLHGQEADRQAFAQELKDAFARYGFVTLEGHGLDTALIAEATNPPKPFRLPEARRMECRSPVWAATSATPFGQGTRDEPRADLKKFYHFAQAHYDQPSCTASPPHRKGRRSMASGHSPSNCESRRIGPRPARRPLHRAGPRRKQHPPGVALPAAPDAPADARAGSHEDITRSPSSSAVRGQIGSAGSGWGLDSRPGHSQHLTVNVGDALKPPVASALHHPAWSFPKAWAAPPPDSAPFLAPGPVSWTRSWATGTPTRAGQRSLPEPPTRNRTFLKPHARLQPGRGTSWPLITSPWRRCS